MDGDATLGTRRTVSRDGRCQQRVDEIAKAAVPGTTSGEVTGLAGLLVETVSLQIGRKGNPPRSSGTEPAAEVQDNGCDAGKGDMQSSTEKQRGCVGARLHDDRATQNRMRFWFRAFRWVFSREREEARDRELGPSLKDLRTNPASDRSDAPSDPRAPLRTIEAMADGLGPDQTLTPHRLTVDTAKRRHCSPFSGHVPYRLPPEATPSRISV